MIHFRISMGTVKHECKLKPADFLSIFKKITIYLWILFVLGPLTCVSYFERLNKNKIKLTENNTSF